VALIQLRHEASVYAPHAEERDRSRSAGTLALLSIPLPQGCVTSSRGRVSACDRSRAGIAGRRANFKKPYSL
jgi:hypothetical protein